MGLKIKRNNMARFASLSALGAGAMVLTTGTADASIVHVVVNQTIGGECGCGDIFVSLPGGAGLGLDASRNSHFSHRTYLSTIRVGTPRMVSATVNLGTVHSAVFLGGSAAFEGPVGPGQAWVVHGTLQLPFLVSSRYSRFRTTREFSLGGQGGVRTYRLRSVGSTPFGAAPYFLFRFIDNGTPLYGWGSLSEGINTTGLEVTFLDYAYDTTGAFLPAGTTGAPVPEPAETIPLGLTALVLGAAGVRRWLASKAA